MHLHVQLFVEHNTCIKCMVVLENMLGAEIAADSGIDRCSGWREVWLMERRDFATDLSRLKPPAESLTMEQFGHGRCSRHVV